MSFFGLALTSKALDAFTVAENVTSENMTNANTPGASRQVVDITQAPPIAGSPAYPTNVSPGTLGDGTIVSTIQRIHDDSYDALYRNANSSQNYYSIQSGQLTLTQSAFSEPTGGLSGLYGTFQSAISAWAASPTEGTNGQNVIAQAQSVATALNSLSSSISSQQTQAVSQATQVVAQANGYLDQIAALNGEIRATKAAGDNANTYQDQRDELIDQLSQLLPVQTSLQADGSALVTVNGRALVNDTVAYHLAAPVLVAPSVATPTNPTKAPEFTIGMANDPNPSNPVPVPLGNGQLAAYQDLYNNKLIPYTAQLNTYASTLATTVNSALAAGYNQNGNPGTALFGANGATTGTVTAGNISVLISNPAQLASASISTAAGALVVPMSSANNTIDPAATFLNNATVNDAPSTNLTGTITVSLLDSAGVAGQTKTFSYDTTPGANSDSINDFLLNFNTANLGVHAIYNAQTQTMEFERDPTVAQNDPNFTLTDSNANAAAGSPATSLLQTLGAAGLSDTSSTAAGPGAGTLTVGSQLASSVSAGQSIVVDGGTANAETVLVTGVNATNGTISGTFANAHGAGATVALVQDSSNALGTADNNNANGLVTILSGTAIPNVYNQLITQVGLDTKAASVANTTQQTLVNNINTTRQSIDGINLDEETNTLVQYQNAYQSTAKAFSVLDALIGTALADISGVSG